jgi:hypothetical protein
VRVKVQRREGLLLRGVPLFLHAPAITGSRGKDCLCAALRGCSGMLAYLQ